MRTHMHAAQKALVIVSMLFAATLFTGCESGDGEVMITGMEPAVSELSGERPVVITGKNFRTDISYNVYFGNKKAMAVTILNSETIQAITPSRDEPGTVDVHVVADNGPAFKLPQAFTFEKTEAGGVNASKRGNLAY